jgi:SNF2 family DNA or RNA helicase
MIELYHDPANQVLVYRGPGCERLVERLREPDAIASAGYIVVRDSLYARQMARWLDLPAPPPMEQYDYPRNRAVAPTPTAAQKAMANFCVLHPRCFNLSDMGTMKTLATLWAADFVMQQFNPGECRALIVCPLSITQRTWGDALANHFSGRRTFEIVHGSATKRRSILLRKADFYIINYDGLAIGATFRRKFQLGGLSADIAARNDIQIAIVDEASAYKDRGTDRHKIARLLIGQRRYLWLLTATPTSNYPTDAYGIANLVNNCYGESYTNFHRRTMVQVGKWKWRPAAGSYREAGKLLQPAIRFDIKDVWDGPPLTYQTRDVKLSTTQAKMLADLKHHQVLQLKDTKIEALPNEAVIRNKALQICMGAVYDKDHKAWKTDAASRLNELRNCIEEATRKVLIFVPFTSIIDMLYAELNTANWDDPEAGKYGAIKLNGMVPKAERDRAITAFEADPRLRIAIADPAVIAHGLNQFVAATTVVWWGPIDKTELYIQGNARVHRPGQTFPTTVVHLASTRLEREIFDRTKNNQTLQGVMLSWIKDERL